MIKSLLLLPERAAISQTAAATGGAAENLLAVAAQDNGLSMREHSGDVPAALALHVHEERVGGLHQALQLVLLGLNSLDGETEICVKEAHCVDYDELCGKTDAE